MLRTSSTFSCDIARPVSRLICPRANGERRAEPPRRKVVANPPLYEMGADQRSEFHEALLDADGFEDLPGKWQAAISEAEQNRPALRVVSGD
jgi:hypothetical protein